MPNILAKADKLSISRKVVFGVAFTLFMLLLLALVSFISSQRFLATSVKVGESREILVHCERARRYVVQMEGGVRGYMLLGDAEFLTPFEVGQSFIVQELGELKKSAAEGGEQAERLQRLRTLVSEMFAFHESIIGKRREFERTLDTKMPAAEKRDLAVKFAAATFGEPETRRKAAEIFTALNDELSEFEGHEHTHLKELRETFETIGSVTTSLVIGGTSLTYIALLGACLFVLRDIAERRRAEEALAVERNLLRSIMDTIPDSIFVKDTMGRYTRDNAAHRRQLGCESEADVIGKTNSEFFPPNLAARYTADDSAVLLGEKTMIDTEEPSRTPDGQNIWLETTKVPLAGPDGIITGLVGVSADITQRRADQERLVHFAEALQKSNSELQDFASAASHDLQEPLRKIQAFGDRLRTRNAGELSETARDYLGRMLDAAQRMQTLIQDLLKLSRVTTRAQPFELVDLSEVVSGVLSDLEVKIAASSARITVAGLPVIEADPTQMRQLIQNFVTNALKFQKPGGVPEVIITARTFANAGEMPGIPRGAKLCELRVVDNGIGFDQQFAEQIFSPFKRLHTRTEYEGSGIGLTLCRKITDRHHGKITTQSAEGKGATFIVTLPFKQPQTHERRSEAHNHPDGR